MLVQCLYASRSKQPITDATVAAVLDASRRNNPPLGITGLLCHTDTLFMQIIEGGRSEVSTLLARIMRDDRHSDMTVLVFDEIEERAFCDWSMGQASLDKLNPGHVLKYSPRLDIDPFSGPGRIMLAMLLDMRAHGGIVTN